MTMTAIPQSLFQDDTIELEFQRFDARHPEVYARILQIVAHRADMGVRRISMKWCFEEVRQGDWHGDADSSVKLNNDLSSRYTRKLIAEHPQFAHLFRTRPLKS